jgi:branched-chain amino acid transport system permease protein
MADPTRAHTSFFPSFKDNPTAAYAATIAIAIALAAMPFVVGTQGNAWVRILDFALLYVMLALGLNIVVGYAGLLDLGYVAFYAVGAYMYALLASPHLAENFEFIREMFPDGLHSSIWLVVPLGAGLAALFGVLLGAPTLRLRGDYLAIVTLGFGEIVRIFLNNLNSPVNLTNGPQGISNIDPIRVGGVNLGRTQTWFGVEVPSVYLYYYLFLTLAIVVIVLTIRLQDSRLGRAWMAIREDEIAAKAMGINTRNVKLLAFAMGASFGGVAGAMFSAFQGFVSPESFVLMESIVIVAMVVLGGMGHVPGVILGALLLYAIPEVLRFVAKPAQEALFGHELVAPEALRMLLFGLAMVVIMLYRPRGLWPAPQHGVKAPPPDGGPSAGVGSTAGDAAPAAGAAGGAR